MTVDRHVMIISTDNLPIYNLFITYPGKGIIILGVVAPAAQLCTLTSHTLNSGHPLHLHIHTLHLMHPFLSSLLLPVVITRLTYM